MKVTHLVVIILISHFLLACNDKKSAKQPHSKSTQTNNEKPALGKIQLKSPDQIPTVINDAQIFCADLNNCPSFAGSFIKVKPSANEGFYSLNKCSLTLISENQVITNDHCFTDYELNNLDCSGVYIILPKNKNFDKEVLTCKKIVSLNQYYNQNIPDNPDWVILELNEKTARPAAEINPNGVANKLNASVYPTYYEKSGKGETLKNIRGIIKKVNCKSSMSNVSTYSYNNPTTQMLGFDCDSEIIKGNSGSGVINTNNEFIGILKFKVKKQQYSYMGKNIQIIPWSFIATNAYCIQALNLNLQNPCSFIDSKDELTAQRNQEFGYYMSHSIDEKLMKKYQDFIKQNNNMKWDNISPQLIDLYGLVDNNDSFADQSSNYVKNNYFKNKYPKVPSCLYKDLNPDKFSLVIPYFTPHEINSSMSFAGSIVTPMKIQSLAYEVLFDSNRQNYKAKLIRMADTNELNRYIILMNTYYYERSKCYSSPNWLDCQKFYDKNNEINNFIKNSNYANYLFFNEYNIYVGNLIGNKEVIIPMCE